MTAVRRSLTTKQKLEVLVRYSHCPRCGQRFGALDEIDFDHIGQLELTNDNSLENFRPLHRADCHKRKTAEDAAARGKVRRCAKDKAEFCRRILAKDLGEPRPAPKRAGRKLQSRGFEKRRKP